MAVDETDLIQRTSNDEPNLSNANTWATYEEMEELVKFRLDAGLWDSVDVDLRIRAMVSAYHDINRLAWSRGRGLSQSRDYEFEALFEDRAMPPIEDPEFLRDVKRAQMAQTLFYLAGTQVRDMARMGIRMSRALSGSEMEFTGYRGAVCTEALEILAPWIDLFPRRRRMR